MIEYEKKILLTFKEYLTVLGTLGKDKHSYSQTNYYFDTENLDMYRKGITYRIRQKGGKTEATVKNHNTEFPDKSIEKNLKVKSCFDVDVFGIKDLQFSGRLYTKRTVLFKDRFCEMVLDSNNYIGCVDYELETEYLKGHEADAMKLIYEVAEILISKDHISDTEELFNRIGKSKSKSDRFFERKYEIEI